MEEERKQSETFQMIGGQNDISSMSSSPTVAEQPMSWTDWHIENPGNEFLVNIEISYLLNQFNMTDLKDFFSSVAQYENALAQVTGLAPTSVAQLEDPDFQATYKDAVDLYGLIHFRYLQTKEGLIKMKKKFLNKEFGTCPRV